MNSMRRAGFAAILLCAVLGTSCGDIFRPIGIPIGQNPSADPQALRMAVVLNQGNGANGSLTFVNASGAVSVGERPVGVEPVHAAHGLTTRVYVANRGDDSINIESYLLPLPPGIGQPDLVRFTSTRVSMPDGSAPAFVMPFSASTTFVAFSGLNTVGVIGATDVLSEQIPVGNTPVAIAGNQGSSKIYVVNQGDDTVSAIRTGDNVVGATIPVGNDPVWAVMNPENTFVYVLNRGSQTVSVIRTADDTVTATLNVGAAPNRVQFDRRLRRLYVANTGGNTVHIFRADLPTPELLAEVTVGQAPTAVAALEDGLRAYVANSGSNTVSVINTNNNQVIRTIDVGEGPAWIAATPNSAQVFTANRDSNNVTVIATATDTVTASVPSGAPAPSFILVTP